MVRMSKKRVKRVEWVKVGETGPTPSSSMTPSSYVLKRRISRQRA